MQLTWTYWRMAYSHDKPFPICQANQPLDMLKFLSVKKGFLEENATFSLALLYEKFEGGSDSLDALLLKFQPGILHTWLESLKASDEAEFNKLPEILPASCKLTIDELRRGLWFFHPVFAAALSLMCIDVGGLIFDRAWARKITWTDSSHFLLILKAENVFMRSMKSRSLRY